MVNKIELHCDGCGVTFERALSATKYSAHHYCSKLCYHKSFKKDEPSYYQPVSKDIYRYKCMAVLKWYKCNRHTNFKPFFIERLKKQLDINKKPLTEKQKKAVDNIIEKWEIDVKTVWDSRWPVLNQSIFQKFIGYFKR